MPEWPSETVEDCLVRLPLRATTKVQAQDYRPSGLYPIIDQGQALIAGWTDDDSGLISTDLPLVVFGDHTRAFKYVDFPFVAVQTERKSSNRNPQSTRFFSTTRYAQSTSLAEDTIVTSRH